MNKKIIISLLTLLALSACNGSQNSNSESSSSPNSVDAINPPSDISGLKELFEEGGTSYVLEEQETQSSTRHTEEVVTKLWDIETTVINENLTAYVGPFVYISGNEKVTHVMTDDFVPQYPEENDTFEKFRGIYNQKYYEVTDYGDGKERDYAVKLDVSSKSDETHITSEEITHYTTTTACDFVSSYLENLSSNIGNLTPEEKNDGFSYHLTAQGVNSDEYGEYPYVATFDIDLSKDGFLKHYKLEHKVRLRDSYTNEETDYGSISDEVTITRGARKEVYKYPLVPTDYWMSDYEVQLNVTNRDLETSNVEPTQIPIDCYVGADIKSVTPSKALDTKLSITSSSDNNVVSVNQYGVVRSVGAGTATLTITSESGLTKTIQVTVFIPNATSISLKCYSSNFYVGETYNLYVYLTPDNVREELVWKVDNEQVLQVDKDDAGDPIFKCLAEGTATITVSLQSNSNVSDSLEITVTKKLSDDQFNSVVLGKWINVNYEAQYIQFNEDKTGVFFYDYEFGFTWELTITETKVTIKLSNVTPKTEEISYTYDGENTADVSLDGLTLRLELGFSSLDYWAYVYQGTFKKGGN